MDSTVWPEIHPHPIFGQAQNTALESEGESWPTKSQGKSRPSDRTKDAQSSLFPEKHMKTPKKRLKKNTNGVLQGVRFFKCLSHPSRAG